ncbi:hypothetical protein WEN_00945 [Mycoplasma wenyonii str. Massachusetts]|uniref:Uncharacterized protein n=1 Tax=Mycoplasma wenyonii (strain Massachusetts) TaxID=1197325 RepID=I6ZII3_MYCWM|nr:hypothetical protein [Mycoplasma wenyonii]AFN64990.1 hypothetical protein WEN_00945 [Mycoplasma wenyonii str. Massachusetts]
MLATALQPIPLDTQGFSLPVSETYSDTYVAPPAITLKASHNDLKKYYLKLKRNLTFSIIFAQLFLMGFAWFTFNACYKIWSSSSSSSSSSWLVDMKFEKSIWVGGNWAKIPFTVGLGALLWGCVTNVGRLVKKRKQVKWECELCQSGRHPSSLTPGLCQSIFSLFGWRINCYWTGFTISGLAVIAAVYTYLTKGFRNEPNGWKVEFTKWTQEMFKWDGKEEDKALRVILAVFLFGLVIIFISNFLSRQLIKRSLSVFKTDESNMHPELKEKVFRLNKRDKIISTIILCVLGLGIFIIFKRLIIAVFNRSFNVSRW